MSREPVADLRVIRPSKGWPTLAVAEILRHRNLLLTLAVRDTKLRYRQTVLGVVWVVAQPLAGAAVFAFVFGKVAGLPSEGLPHMAFSYIGFIAWSLFANTLARSSVSLVSNAHLVSKVYFPRLILPLSTVFSSLLDFGVGLAVMVVLLRMYGVPLGRGVLLLPLAVVPIVMLGLGVGVLLSGLMVRFRDVKHVVPLMTQLLLYASPVGYSQKSVPEAFQALYSLNPLAGLLEFFRWSVLGVGNVDVANVAYAAALAIIIFYGGPLLFRRLERDFADVI